MLCDKCVGQGFINGAECQKCRGSGTLHDVAPEKPKSRVSSPTLLDEIFGFILDLNVEKMGKIMIIIFLLIIVFVVLGRFLG